MRKAQLWLSVSTVVGLLAASCAQATPAPQATEPVAAEPTATSQAIVVAEASATPAPTAEVSEDQYKEAPQLADMVAAGDLPPVAERLPANPVVTTPVESVGQYGGTIQTASWWPEVGNVQLYFAVEAPIKWKADLTGYEAALVESYEWSDDGKTFTMHLREGLKWSDGEPYTSADWQFWWEDFAKNEEQKVWTIPAYLRNNDGTPITMSFPDEYTVVWESTDRPLYIDPYFMAQGFWEFAKNFMKPAHYLKDYHPEYSDKTWEDYTNQDKWWQTPGYPCLFAWCLTELSEDGQNYTFSRNPYYWRVDTEGNQLPYIDEIKVEIVADEQTRILNCSQGKYDTAFRICGGPNEIPFLAENAAAGEYHFLENYLNGAGAWPGYMINQYYVEGGKNYENDTPEKAAEIRSVLRDQRFRIALSTGFDRQRIIDVAWGGIGEAKGATISPQSWHFAGEGQAAYEKWANAYAETDIEGANALLDDLGMAVGADGFRTLPSGEPFVLTVDVSDWGGSLKVQVDAADEMKRQYEENLSIAVSINNLQGQPDLDTRTNEGYYMLRGAHISEIDILTYPDWMYPIVNRYMFPLEGRYFAKGGEACTEEPNESSQYPCGVAPEEGSPAQLLQDLYLKARDTATIEDRHAVVWETIDVIVEQGPFVIGVGGDQPMPIIVKDHMRNILDFGVVGPWAPSTPGNQIAAQWWIEQ
ncbi:MAG TPA: ABC transporter substrate-binding protein [Anaerolineales bacterium]|nr:ABC transporter substrate-binding protein [Anaerolineales bacterium]